MLTRSPNTAKSYKARGQFGGAGGGRISSPTIKIYSRIWLGAEVGDALLVDRETHRCFSAHYQRAVGSDADGVDEARVPPYYRHEISNVSGWFLLDEINETEYRHDIAERFGQLTILVLTESREVKKEEGDAAPLTMQRPAILHLSDLHFGNDYCFLYQGQKPKIGAQTKTLTHCLIEDLKRADLLGKVGLLLITGDFTTQGDFSDETRLRILAEFDALQKALGITKDQIVAVPGNHDIVRYKPEEKIDADTLAAAKQTRYKHENDYRLFMEELTGRKWNEPLHYHRMFRAAEFDLVVAALNSCTITATEWTEYGYVGDLGVSVLNEVASIPVSRPTFRVVALHHHVVPVNKVEAPYSKGVSLTLDAVDILDAGQRAGFHFLIHGHQHLPRVSRYGRIPSIVEADARIGEMFIISGGSAGAVASRLPGAERNAYTVLSLGSDNVQLVMRELRTDAKAGATLYNCPLGVKPAAP